MQIKSAVCGENLHFFTWKLDRYAVGSWKLDVYCAAQRLLSVGRLVLLRNVYFLVNRKRVAHVRLAFGLRDLSVIAP